MYCQPYLALGVEHASEVAPGDREVRSCLDRLQVAGLEKQNAIYSGFIRELEGTRAARYARPPIAAPQLLNTRSLSHSHALSRSFVSFFISCLPVVKLDEKNNMFRHPVPFLFPFLTRLPTLVLVIFERWLVLDLNR